MNESSTNSLVTANYQDATPLIEKQSQPSAQSSASTFDGRTITTKRQFGTVTVRVTTRPSLTNK